MFVISSKVRICCRAQPAEKIEGLLAALVRSVPPRRHPELPTIHPPIPFTMATPISEYASFMTAVGVEPTTQFQMLTQRLILDRTPRLYHDTGEWEYEFNAVDHKPILLRIWRRSNRKDCPWTYDIPDDTAEAIGKVIVAMMPAKE